MRHLYATVQSQSEPALKKPEKVCQNESLASRVRINHHISNYSIREGDISTFSAQLLHFSFAESALARWSLRDCRGHDADISGLSQYYPGPSGETSFTSSKVAAAGGGCAACLYRWKVVFIHPCIFILHSPKTKLSGLNSCPNGPERTESMVPGSRSTRMARGTNLLPFRRKGERCWVFG